MLSGIRDRTCVLNSEGSLSYYPLSLKAYAVDHVSVLRGSYEHFADASPGAHGFEDCENLLTRPKQRKNVADEFSIHHFLAAQQSLESGKLATRTGFPEWCVRPTA